MSLPNLCHSSFSVLPSLREGSFLQEQYPTAACTVSDRVAESVVFLYIYIPRTHGDQLISGNIEMHKNYNQTNRYQVP